jgi:hypothetical protein
MVGRALPTQYEALVTTFSTQNAALNNINLFELLPKNTYAHLLLIGEWGFVFTDNSRQSPAIRHRRSAAHYRFKPVFSTRFLLIFCETGDIIHHSKALAIDLRFLVLPGLILRRFCFCFFVIYGSPDFAKLAE